MTAREPVTFTLKSSFLLSPSHILMQVVVLIVRQRKARWPKERRGQIHHLKYKNEYNEDKPVYIGSLIASLRITNR